MPPPACITRRQKPAPDFLGNTKQEAAICFYSLAFAARRRCCSLLAVAVAVAVRLAPNERSGRCDCAMPLGLCQARPLGSLALGVAGLGVRGDRCCSKVGGRQAQVLYLQRIPVAVGRLCGRKGYAWHGLSSEGRCRRTSPARP